MEVSPCVHVIPLKERAVRRANFPLRTARQNRPKCRCPDPLHESSTGPGSSSRMSDGRPALSRREAIAGVAAAAAGAGLYVLLRGGPEEADSASETAAAADCVLTPQQTEGPYYIDN